MVADTNWRELFRTTSLYEARTIATTLEAMEFPAQLRVQDVHSSSSEEAELHLEKLTGLKGPFVISVAPEDWPHLIAVLDELIEEQRSFDAELEAQQQLDVQRNMLILVSAIGVTVALLLLIRERSGR
ncbi:MAG TPA: hypothetical protein VG711_12220 [Phycisphaerales bacterium]|nr:hypothetical protein [Phycisphaerales bacterium]